MSQEQGVYAVCARLLGPAVPKAEAFDTVAGPPESRRINRMERVALAYGGKLVRKDKRMLLASFATADAATLAACEMQRRCFGMPRLVNRPLSLHIGIHRVAKPSSRRPPPSGIKERRDNDRRFGFGMAMFLAGKTADDGILVSGLVFRTLMPNLREHCKPRNGTSVGTPVYDLDWNSILSLQTHVSLLASPSSPSDRQLVLRIGTNRLVLGSLNTVATFGRDPACDVTISDKLVSREHACIEIRSEGCVLTDHSTNGTNIVFHSGHEVLVKNESLLIEGRGRISLGRTAGKNDAGVIEFRVNTTG